MIDVFLLTDMRKIIYENGNEVEIDSIITNIDIDFECKKFLKYIENQKINNMKIKDMYLWENIEIYNFFRASYADTLKDIIGNVILGESILKELEEKEFLVKTDSSLIVDIFRNVLKIKNVEYVENIKQITDSYKSNYYKIARRLIKGIFKLFKYKLEKSKKDNILIFTQVGSINSLKIGEDNIQYDSLYGIIRDQLIEKSNLCEVQFLNSRNMISKSELLGSNFIPFEIIQIFKKIEQRISKLTIKNELRYIDEFDYVYKNYNLNNIIKEKLINILPDTYNSYILEIKVWERLLKFLKIKKVITVDEADRPRCLIVAANRLNLKSFAIQHGLINETSSAYLIPSKDEILIPSTTFLWGNSFKELLIKNTNVYKDKNLQIIGQPRTDYLHKKIKDKQFDKDNKKKILFVTQPIEDLAQGAINMLCESLTNLENYKLIIKLHPADKLHKMYEACCIKNGITNYEITKELDIYDALIWCDLIISVHSTVVLEGAILNKPSICIILPKYNDEGNFVKSGLSMGASSSNELCKLLSDSEVLKKINYEPFIKDNFYKIDGQVYIRAIDRILEGESMDV